MTDPSTEMREVLCACGDKLPIGTYYVSDEGSVHVHHGRTECHICDHPDRKDAKDLRARAILSAQPETWNIPDPCEHGTQPPIRCEHCYPPVSQPSTTEKKS